MGGLIMNEKDPGPPGRLLTDSSSEERTRSMDVAPRPPRLRKRPARPGNHADRPPALPPTTAAPPWPSPEEGGGDE